MVIPHYWTHWTWVGVSRLGDKFDLDVTLASKLYNEIYLGIVLSAYRTIIYSSKTKANRTSMKLNGVTVGALLDVSVPFLKSLARMH